MINHQLIYLIVVVLFSILVVGCGSNSQSRLERQTYYRDWLACNESFSTNPCLSFASKYPKKNVYRDLTIERIERIENLQAAMKKLRAKTLAKEIEAQDKLELNFERDRRLPIEVRRDKYMLALTTHLKNERYHEAMKYFGWLERLNTKLSPSFNYFYGEALLKTGDPEGAITKLYAYITEIGSKGKFYTRALEMANEAENFDSASIQTSAQSKQNTFSTGASRGGQQTTQSFEAPMIKGRSVMQMHDEQMQEPVNSMILTELAQFGSPGNVSQERIQVEAFMRTPPKNAEEAQIQKMIQELRQLGN